MSTQTKNKIEKTSELVAMTVVPDRFEQDSAQLEEPVIITIQLAFFPQKTEQND